MKHNVSQMMETGAGKYLLVNSLSRRIRALQSGSRPLVARPSSDMAEVAMEEFRQEKVDVYTNEDDKTKTSEAGETAK